MRCGRSSRAERGEHADQHDAAGVGQREKIPRITASIGLPRAPTLRPRRLACPGVAACAARQKLDVMRTGVHASDNRQLGARRYSKMLQHHVVSDALATSQSSLDHPHCAGNCAQRCKEFRSRIVATESLWLCAMSAADRLTVALLVRRAQMVDMQIRN